MAAKPLPSAAYLRQCFTYAPETGVLAWQPSRPREHFKLQRAWLNWSSCYAGQTAGTITGLGYVYVTLRAQKQRFLVHRIIWKIMTGEDPVAVIDHRNGNPSDNRWSNLRAATREQNQWNTKSNKGRSLPRGVHMRKELLRRKYVAGVSYRNRRICLGHFATPEEARECYLSFVRQHRGEFGNVE